MDTQDLDNTTKLILSITKDISLWSLGNPEIEDPDIYKVAIYRTQLKEKGLSEPGELTWRNNNIHIEPTGMPDESRGWFQFAGEHQPIFCSRLQKLFGSTTELILWNHLNGYEPGHMYICYIRELSPSREHTAVIYKEIDRQLNQIATLLFDDNEKRINDFLASMYYSLYFVIDLNDKLDIEEEYKAKYRTHADMPEYGKEYTAEEVEEITQRGLELVKYIKENCGNENGSYNQTKPAILHSLTNAARGVVIFNW